MKNKIEYLNVSLALTLLSLALLHVQSSSYPLESIIHVAKALKRPKNEHMRRMELAMSKTVFLQLILKKASK